jgi:hypothetical protein
VDRHGNKKIFNAFNTGIDNNFFNNSLPKARFGFGGITIFPTLEGFFEFDVSGNDVKLIRHYAKGIDIPETESFTQGNDGILHTNFYGMSVG